MCVDADTRTFANHMLQLGPSLTTTRVRTHAIVRTFANHMLQPGPSPLCCTCTLLVGGWCCVRMNGGCVWMLVGQLSVGLPLATALENVGGAATRICSGGRWLSAPLDYIPHQPCLPSLDCATNGRDFFLSLTHSCRTNRCYLAFGCAPSPPLPLPPQCRSTAAHASTRSTGSSSRSRAPPSQPPSNT